MEKVAVSAKALQQLLCALNGPAYYVGELQATRDHGRGLFPDNPIDVLICEFNDAVEKSKRGIIDVEPCVIARLQEAHDYGQFADDFDQPLAKPLRADIRTLLNNIGKELVAMTRLRTLRVLCGYVENGSETSVTLFQDDATRDWMLLLGPQGSRKTLCYGASFEQLLDNAKPTADEYEADLHAC